MWLAIQNSLATLLYERGREVLELMGPLLGTDSPGPESQAGSPPASTPPEVLNRAPVHMDIVEPLSRAAASVFQHPDQSEEVRLAVSDLLHSGYGAAVDWLTRSCFAFVCACSLGLEVRTQAALEAIIQRTSLVLDTDVVLSLLSADEPPHESVNALTKQWREFGGQVLVSKEVLSEVAYHAWIAQNDLDHVADFWPAAHMDRQILSRNAFVRGFGRLLERGEVKPANWLRWMQQYRGRSPGDVTAIRTTLVRDRGFGELPAPNKSSRELAKSVQSYLVQKNSLRSSATPYDEREEFIRTDKARRDSSLFASLTQAIAYGESFGDGRMTYLVTSSGRFRDVQRKFGGHDANFVLSMPAAVYMLSMVPGRTLGLTALRAFLFDGRWQERVSDFQLLALRVVKRSAEFDMPWAKRSQLLRELRGRVETVARSRSTSGRPTREAVEQVQEEWMSGKTDDLTKALAGSLDQVAADRAVEAKLSAAEKRILELEKQLDAEKRKPPTAPARKRTGGKS
jgi:hypothetical protein